MTRSTLEQSLWTQIKQARLPTPQEQYKAIPGRKFTYDFAYPESRILIECQGAVFKPGLGGHSSGTGITRDAVKVTLATIHGWHPLVFTAAHIKSGEAIQWLRQALELYPPF